MDEMPAVPDQGRQLDGAPGGCSVVRGIVVHGDGRGRQIGYPTANVAVAGGQVLPADGVYAGTYERADGTRHPALISLGRRPSFYERGRRVLEVHLLDCDDILYGEYAGVTFFSRLRGQLRFESATSLVRQIRHDVAAAREALAARGWTTAAG